MQMLTNFNGEFVNELLVEGCSVKKRLKILGANLVANVAGDKSCRLSSSSSYILS